MKGPKKYIHHIMNEEYGKGDNFVINLYQKWISPVNGTNNCPMYPSCSQYTKLAFQALPWHSAYFKSCERILRCGHELHLYKIIRIEGAYRWYDPLIYKKAYDKSQIKIHNP